MTDTKTIQQSEVINVQNQVMQSQVVQNQVAQVSTPVSIDSMIREIYRIISALSDKRIANLYKLMDMLENEREGAVQAVVCKYKDKTVFWVSMAGCGLQGLNLLSVLAPQVLPQLADQVNSSSPFGELINLNRFKKVTGEFDYNEISKAAENVLGMPAKFVDPFRVLYDSSLNGDKTEAQAASERLKELASQRRQECNQALSKDEETLRNERERIRQEEQAREIMAREDGA